MTRPGAHPLPPELLRRLATLVHLHELTKPERLARHYGLSAEYVRRQWRHRHEHEMAPLAEALEELAARNTMAAK